MKKVSKLVKMSAAMAMVAASIQSCRPEQEDLTLPKIESILVDEINEDLHQVEAGNDIHLDIHVSDDRALRQMKINVHPADDGHGHGSVAGVVEAPNVGVWTESKIIDLEGSSAQVQLTLSLPSDIKGFWHVEVMLLDESGNEAEEVFTTLQVLNLGLPQALFTWNPVISSTDQLVHVPSTNPQVTFTGDITDADGLASLYWAIYSEAGVLVDAQMMDGAGLINMSTGNIQVTLPGSGLYDWTFRATDQNGYYNEWVQEVIVE
jgi:hypothetical protein